MIDVTCKVCGGPVPHFASARAKFCSERCSRDGSKTAPGVWLWNNWKARRKALGLPVGPRSTPSVADLVMRDGLDCHICTLPIDHTIDPMTADGLTVDHLIPVSDPRATHTAENLKLAHRRCNTLRGNGTHNDRAVA